MMRDTETSACSGSSVTRKANTKQEGRTEEEAGSLALPSRNPHTSDGNSDVHVWTNSLQNDTEYVVCGSLQLVIP